MKIFALLVILFALFEDDVLCKIAAKHKRHHIIHSQMKYGHKRYIPYSTSKGTKTGTSRSHVPEPHVDLERMAYPTPSNMHALKAKLHQVLKFKDDDEKKGQPTRTVRGTARMTVFEPSDQISPVIDSPGPADSTPFTDISSVASDPMSSPPEIKAEEIGPKEKKDENIPPTEDPNPEKEILPVETNSYDNKVSQKDSESEYRITTPSSIIRAEEPLNETPPLAQKPIVRHLNQSLNLFRTTENTDHEQEVKSLKPIPIKEKIHTEMKKKSKPAPIHIEYPKPIIVGFRRPTQFALHQVKNDTIQASRNAPLLNLSVAADNSKIYQYKAGVTRDSVHDENADSHYDDVDEIDESNHEDGPEEFSQAKLKDTTTPADAVINQNNKIAELVAQNGVGDVSSVQATKPSELPNKLAEHIFNTNEKMMKLSNSLFEGSNKQNLKSQQNKPLAPIAASNQIKGQSLLISAVKPFIVKSVTDAIPGKLNSKNNINAQPASLNTRINTGSFLNTLSTKVSPLEVNLVRQASKNIAVMQGQSAINNIAAPKNIAALQRQAVIDNIGVPNDIAAMQGQPPINNIAALKKIAALHRHPVIDSIKAPTNIAAVQGKSPINDILAPKNLAALHQQLTINSIGVPNDIAAVQGQSLTVNNIVTPKNIAALHQQPAVNIIGVPNSIAAVQGQPNIDGIAGAMDSYATPGNPLNAENVYVQSFMDINSYAKQPSPKQNVRNTADFQKTGGLPPKQAGLMAQKGSFLYQAPNYNSGNGYQVAMNLQQGYPAYQARLQRPYGKALNPNLKNLNKPHGPSIAFIDAIFQDRTKSYVKTKTSTKAKATGNAAALSTSKANAQMNSEKSSSYSEKVAGLKGKVQDLRHNTARKQGSRNSYGWGEGQGFGYGRTSYGRGGGHAWAGDNYDTAAPYGDYGQLPGNGGPKQTNQNPGTGEVPAQSQSTNNAPQTGSPIPVQPQGEAASQTATAPQSGAAPQYTNHLPKLAGPKKQTKQAHLTVNIDENLEEEAEILDKTKAAPGKKIEQKIQNKEEKPKGTKFAEQATGSGYGTGFGNKESWGQGGGYAWAGKAPPQGAPNPADFMQKPSSVPVFPQNNGGPSTGSGGYSNSGGVQSTGPASQTAGKQPAAAQAAPQPQPAAAPSSFKQNTLGKAINVYQNQAQTIDYNEQNSSQNDEEEKEEQNGAVKPSVKQKVNKIKNVIKKVPPPQPQVSKYDPDD